jgi:hypothetical protein
MISACTAGNHDTAPVYPCLHGNAGNKKAVTSSTELPSQIARNTNPFFHSNPAGKGNTAVTPFRVFRKKSCCLLEENANSFLGDNLSASLLMPLCHHTLLLFPVVR